MGIGKHHIETTLSKFIWVKISAKSTRQSNSSLFVLRPAKPEF